MSNFRKLYKYCRTIPSQIHSFCLKFGKIFFTPQRIIAVFKKRYRGHLLQKYVDKGLNLKEFYAEDSILDAMKGMATVWDDVKEAIMEKGWTNLLSGSTRQNLVETPPKLPQDQEEVKISPMSKDCKVENKLMQMT